MTPTTRNTDAATAFVWLPLAAGPSGNKTSGSGADRKQEQEDREEA